MSEVCDLMCKQIDLFLSFFCDWLNRRWIFVMDAVTSLRYSIYDEVCLIVRSVDKLVSMICDFCLRLVAGLQNMKHLTFLNLSANSIQVSVFLMMLLMITEMYRLLPTDIVVCFLCFGHLTVSVNALCYVFRLSHSSVHPVQYRYCDIS